VFRQNGEQSPYFSLPSVQPFPAKKFADKAEKVYRGHKVKNV
jgi:hypothetical protein